jgi:uncharacterized protein YdeI (YjbR/CyaY-like superfamily)
MPAPEYIRFHPRTRSEWRQWLMKYHGKQPGVWFVFYKKESGKPRVQYDEAVEEALCFGWIDSLPRKLDAERSMLKFTPRKPKSVWSALNKQRVKKLIRLKQMMPAGRAAILLAQKNGSWDTLTESDRLAANNQVPDDLAKLLSTDKKAAAHFTTYSKSIRKQFLVWISSAKRPDTREARLQQTLQMAIANKKPGAKGFKL